MSTLPDDFFIFDDFEEPVIEHSSIMVLSGGIPDMPVINHDDFPLGVVRGDDEGLGDLGGFMQEGSIQDLSWLEVDEQDLDRLPKAPHDGVIEELEEAWSRKGDYNERYTARDLATAQAHERMAQEDVSETTRQDRATVAKVIQKAMRRSAAGAKFKALLSEAVRAMEGDPQASRALEAVRANHGLVGRVFIQASAYPGCATGRWTDEVKKRSASARYVVAKPECTNCVRAQQGTCAAFNKKLVVKVPWKQARRLYTPALEATGRSVTGSDHKKALRKAFRAPAYKSAVQDGARQVHIAPSQRVSLEESRAALAATTRVRKVIAGDRSASGKLRQAQLHVARLVTAGLLDKEIGVRLVKRSDLDADALMTLAEKAASGRSIETAEFSGAPNRASQESRADLDEAHAALAATKKGRRKIQARFRPLLRWARQKMSEGLVGTDLNQLLRSRWSPNILRDASEVLRSTRGSHEGLSGMLYVDAAAYASPTGTKGCEEGALRHRANQLKHVLAMNRCKGCTHASRKADGTPVCRMYKKFLTARAPTENAKAYQEESLRVAEASDAEVTASYFSPSYDQEEFRLSTVFDEALDLDEASSPEMLGDVLFGDGLVLQ